ERLSRQKRRERRRFETSTGSQPSPGWAKLCRSYGASHLEGSVKFKIRLCLFSTISWPPVVSNWGTGPSVPRVSTIACATETVVSTIEIHSANVRGLKTTKIVAATAATRLQQKAVLRHFAAYFRG